jgi:hypothetical protein
MKKRDKPDGPILPRSNPVGQIIRGIALPSLGNGRIQFQLSRLRHAHALGSEGDSYSGLFESRMRRAASSARGRH